MKVRRMRCTVNGTSFDQEVPLGFTLLEFLRESVHLTGSKEGCDKGECGACTVLIGSVPVTACMRLAHQAEGADITTIEGLVGRWRDQSGDTSAELHPVQQSFVDCGAVQCGFCTPGLIVSAASLLEKVERPSTSDIKRALEGNLCRCTGYTRVFEAVEEASKTTSMSPMHRAHKRASRTPA